MKVKYRGIYFHPTSNITPWNLPYRVGSKQKTVPEENFNEELPAGIGDDSYYYPLVIDDDFKMGDMSVGNCSINDHIIFQHYCDLNNADVSSWCCFWNIHTLYQFEDSSTFRKIY